MHLAKLAAFSRRTQRFSRLAQMHEELMDFGSVSQHRALEWPSNYAYWPSTSRIKPLCSFHTGSPRSNGWTAFLF